MRHSGDKLIKRIEAHSFKSMPPVHEEIYDGWTLRLSNSRTKRINSVNFLENSTETIDLSTKIDFCETYYNQHKYPCRFRITPLTYPLTLEENLLERGYQGIDKTDILLQDLTNYPRPQSNASFTIESTASDEWLEVVCSLTGRDTEDEKRSFCDTLKRIEIETCYASVLEEGKIVACGLATISDNIMGLFEIATNPSHRRSGLGRSLINQLLKHGVRQDVKTAYLQVTQSNETGRLFWNSVGFSKHLYCYQYWVQPYDK